MKICHRRTFNHCITTTDKRHSSIHSPAADRATTAEMAVVLSDQDIIKLLSSESSSRDKRNEAEFKMNSEVVAEMDPIDREIQKTVELINPVVVLKGEDGNTMPVVTPTPFNSTHNATSAYPQGAILPGFLGRWLVILAQIFNVSPFFMLVLLGVFVFLFIITCSYCCWRFRKKKQKPFVYKYDTFKEPLVGFGEFEDLHIYGDIRLAMTYITKRKRLEIRILYSTDLPGIQTDPPDAYVEVSVLDAEEEKERIEMEKRYEILPGRKDAPKNSPTKYHTKVIRDDFTPVWNETFKFNVNLEELERKIISCRVFNYDPSGRSSLIGEVAVPISEFAPESYIGSLLEITRYLEKGSEDIGNGDICILLKHDANPSGGTIFANVIEGRNLNITRRDVANRAKVTVEMTLFEDKKKLSKVMSEPVTCITEHPYINLSTLFKFKNDRLLADMHIRIEITLKRSPMSPLKKRLGVVRIGPKVESEGGQRHWRLMIKNITRPVARWHNL